MVLDESYCRIPKEEHKFLQGSYHMRLVSKDLIGQLPSLFEHATVVVMLCTQRRVYEGQSIIHVVSLEKERIKRG